MIVCELSTASRLFYRFLGPLISGGSVFSAVVSLAARPLRDKEVPSWMESFAFHAAVAAFLLVFALWLASRISAVSASIRLDGKELHVRSFWSGRLLVLPVRDVVAVGPEGIRFKDGRILSLEGRTGPGLPALTAILPGTSAPPGRPKMQ